MTDYVTLPLLNPRGAYDPTILYDPNDLITYNGVPYFCRIGIINGQPVTPGSDPNTWQLLTEPGETGAKGDKGDPGQQGPQGKQGVTGQDGTGYTFKGVWSASSAYNAGDTALYPTSGSSSVWISLKANTNVTPGTDSTVWISGDSNQSAAANSAQASANSAAAALASQNAAATSASAAAGSQSAAATSAGNAANSATAAATSATNSANSATASANSATAAAASAASAGGWRFSAFKFIGASGTTMDVSYDGTLVQFGSSAAISSTMMPHSSFPTGHAMLLTNTGSADATVTKGSGTNNYFYAGTIIGQVSSFVIKPGQWVALVGRGSDEIDMVAGSALEYLRGVWTISKLMATNSPNMLFNSSGEFANMNWGTSIFGAMTGGFGEGPMFSNGAALSAYSGGDTSSRFTCGAGQQLCLSGEVITSGLTAGSAQMQLIAYDASGNSLGQVCQINAVPFGQAAAMYYGAGTTPANTASVAVAKYTNGATGPAFSAFFRRIKVERGLLPSLYSQEASFNTTANFPGHLNAVNSPNLLPNSTAELANWNWNASNFSPVTADTNGQGTYWLNSAAISVACWDQASQIPVGVGTPIVMSGEIYAKGATAGQHRFGIDFLDSSGNITTTINATAVNGADWAFYYVAGVAPANTVAMRAFRGSFTSPVVTASGVAFRRLKVERGVMPSLYSQEANMALLTNSPTHFNAVNSANLLPNSTGELGNMMWGSSNFAAVSGTGGEGQFFQNQTAISAAIEDLSNNIPVGASVQLNLSYEVNSNGLTAGQAICYIEAFNSSNVALGNSGAGPGVTTAAGWQFKSVAWVTPANTSYVRIHKTVNNTPTVAQYGVSFRRIKLEQGNYPSLYSQEATVDYVDNLPGHFNAINSANLIPNGSGELATYGKNSNNFQTTTASDGTGVYFGLGATISANTYDQWTAVPAIAGAAYTIQGEIYAAGATAGLAQLGIDFLNSSGTIVGSIYAPTIGPGVGWTFTSVAGVAPANTVSMRPFMGAVNTPAAPAQGFRFRRVKVEPGNTPSLYSVEGSLNWIASLWQNNGQATQAIFPASIEVGKYGTAGTTIIDYHTSSVGQDYDSRIGGSGGSTTAGQSGRGAMYVAAKTFAISSDPDNTALSAQFQLQCSGYQVAMRSRSDTPGMEWLSNSGTSIMVLKDDGTLTTSQAIQANTGYRVKAGSSGAFGSNVFNIAWSGSQASLWIDTSNMGVISTTSDYRVKKRISSLKRKGAMDDVMALRPVRYQIRNRGVFKHSGEWIDGFIAHEVQEVIPSGVNGGKDEVDEDGKDMLQSLNPLPLISRLTLGLQEAIEEIRALKERIAELEK